MGLFGRGVRKWLRKGVVDDSTGQSATVIKCAEERLRIKGRTSMLFLDAIMIPPLNTHMDTFKQVIPIDLRGVEARTG